MKKKYEKPEMEIHGSIKTITKYGGTGGSDAEGGGPPIPTS